jgi:hypothetical protein
MEASQHSLLAACFTLHSINATLAIVPQRGAGLWISVPMVSFVSGGTSFFFLKFNSLSGIAQHSTDTVYQITCSFVDYMFSNPSTWSVFSLSKRGEKYSGLWF